MQSGREADWDKRPLGYPAQIGMLQCAPISECYSYTWCRYRYKLRIYRPIPEPGTYNEGVLRQNPSRPPRIIFFWQEHSYM